MNRSALIRLTLLAFLLRVGAAVFWSVALPRWGYGNPPELAGYVMADAYTRDTAAWELAQSGRPLGDAFGYSQAADQYGGLLWLSAGVYRLLGGHYPLVMAALLALLASLSVPLAWAFTRRVWGARLALWTAWGVALYPEAVLLGSAHMREGPGMTLMALGLYGAAVCAEGQRKRGAGWMLLAVFLALPLSPPIAVTVALGCAVTLAVLDEWRFLRRREWQVLLGVAGLALVLLLWMKGGFLLSLLHNVSRYQGYLTKQASGWVQRTFRVLPAWAQLPFLVAYGVARPLLPAALLAGGSPLWQGIAIWRALGWTLVLGGLMLALLRVALERAWLRLPGVWLGLILFQALVASLRGGGDLWDSPRYRAILAFPQIALGVWGWLSQRERPSVWVPRVLQGAILGALWLFPWYVRRYTPLDWAVVSVFKTLGLGVVTLVLYTVMRWAGTSRTD